MNRWNVEMQDHPAPDYFQSFGLGFFEYFQLAEDIGAEPQPSINCGMSCQFNAGEVVPLNELDPYILDALDLIEFQPYLASRIDTPVVLYHGRRDDVVPPQAVQAIAQNVFANLDYHLVDDDHSLHDTFGGMAWDDLLII